MEKVTGWAWILAGSCDLSLGPNWLAGLSCGQYNLYGTFEFWRANRDLIRIYFEITT